jgi:hypothetical protein
VVCHFGSDTDSLRCKYQCFDPPDPLLIVLHRSGATCGRFRFGRINISWTYKVVILGSSSNPLKMIQPASPHIFPRFPAHCSVTRINPTVFFSHSYGSCKCLRFKSCVGGGEPIPQQTGWNDFALLPSENQCKALQRNRNRTFPLP